MAVTEDVKIRARWDGKSLTQGTKQGAKDLDRMGKAAKMAGTALKGMGLMLAATQALRLGKALAATADEWTNITNRITLYTSTAKEAHEVQEQLFQIAQRSRASMSATTELWQRLSQANKQLKLDQGALQGVLETLNKTLVISGTSAESAKAGLIQLGQAFASGELRGEELRSVMEQMPRLTMALTAGLDTNVAGLRKMAEAGELTADRVIKAVQSQQAIIDTEFSGMQVTVEQAGTAMDNAMGRMIDRLNKATGASELLAKAIMNVATSISAVEEGPGRIIIPADYDPNADRRALQDPGFQEPVEPVFDPTAKTVLKSRFGAADINLSTGVVRADALNVGTIGGADGEGVEVEDMRPGPLDWRAYELSQARTGVVRTGETGGMSIAETFERRRGDREARLSAQTDQSVFDMSQDELVTGGGGGGFGDLLEIEAKRQKAMERSIDLSNRLSDVQEELNLGMDDRAGMEKLGLKTEHRRQMLQAQRNNLGPKEIALLEKIHAGEDLLLAARLEVEAQTILAAEAEETLVKSLGHLDDGMKVLQRTVLRGSPDLQRFTGLIVDMVKSFKGGGLKDMISQNWVGLAIGAFDLLFTSTNNGATAAERAAEAQERYNAKLQDAINSANALVASLGGMPAEELIREQFDVLSPMMEMWGRFNERGKEAGKSFAVNLREWFALLEENENRLTAVRRRGSRDAPGIFERPRRLVGGYGRGAGPGSAAPEDASAQAFEDLQQRIRETFGPETTFADAARMLFGVEKAFEGLTKEIENAGKAAKNRAVTGLFDLMEGRLRQEARDELLAAGGNVHAQAAVFAALKVSMVDLSKAEKAARKTTTDAIAVEQATATAAATTPEVPTSADGVTPVDMATSEMINIEASTWGDFGVEGWVDIIDQGEGLDKLPMKKWHWIIDIEPSTWKQFEVEGWTDIIDQGAGIPKLPMKKWHWIIDIESSTWGEFEVGGWTDIIADDDLAPITKDWPEAIFIDKKYGNSDIRSFTGWVDVIDKTYLDDNPLPYDWPDAIKMGDKFGPSGIKSFEGWKDVIDKTYLDDNPLPYDWPDAIAMGDKFGPSSVRSFTGWVDVIDKTYLDDNPLPYDWPDAIEMGDKFGPSSVRSFTGWVDVIDKTYLDDNPLPYDWPDAIKMGAKFGPSIEKSFEGWVDVIDKTYLADGLPYDWPEAIQMGAKFGPSIEKSFVGWKDVIAVEYLEGENRRLKYDWPEAIQMGAKFGPSTKKSFVGWKDVIAVEYLADGIPYHWPDAIAMGDKFGPSTKRSFVGWKDVIAVEYLAEPISEYDWPHAISMGDKYGPSTKRSFGGWADVIDTTRLRDGIPYDWPEAINIDKRYGETSTQDGVTTLTWSDVVSADNLTPENRLGPYAWSDAIGITGTKLEANQIVELPGFSDFQAHFGTLSSVVEYAFTTATTTLPAFKLADVTAGQIIGLPGLWAFYSHFRTLNSKIEYAFETAMAGLTFEPVELRAADIINIDLSGLFTTAGLREALVAAIERALSDRQLRGNPQGGRTT